jgi:hypothetical protein
MLQDNVYSYVAGAEEHLKEIIQNKIFYFALAVLRHAKNIFLLTSVCRFIKTISNNFFKDVEHKI